ncbi:MAG: hypothetical protein K2X82_27450 [Gemmataceae bacterium]|nr:hypothetical protein [Gemmataceae bacterium]
MSERAVTKAAVSVAEMAGMVGLSRARLYQLIEAGVFPPPVYDVRTRRPLYPEAVQRTCLSVRRRGCGVNGRPVVFYAARTGPAAGKRKVRRPPPRPAPPDGRIAALLAGVRGLGLSGVTPADVAAAVRDLFPHGADGEDESGVLTAVFLRLQAAPAANGAGR